MRSMRTTGETELKWRRELLCLFAKRFAKIKCNTLMTIYWTQALKFVVVIYFKLKMYKLKIAIKYEKGWNFNGKSSWSCNYLYNISSLQPNNSGLERYHSNYRKYWEKQAPKPYILCSNWHWFWFSKPERLWSLNKKDKLLQSAICVSLFDVPIKSSEIRLKPWT